MPVLQIAGREGAGVGQDTTRKGRVAHDASAAMVLLDALVVVGVSLVWVGRLLLEVVEHGHRLLPAWGAIDAGVVPLLVVLAVHAAGGRARGALSRGLGERRRLGGGKMGQKRIYKKPVGDLVVGDAVGSKRIREGVEQMAVTICHLRVTRRRVGGVRDRGRSSKKVVGTGAQRD